MVSQLSERFARTPPRQWWVASAPVTGGESRGLRLAACTVVARPGIAAAIVMGMLFGVTALTYLLGGTQHATPHLYYLPIILSAFTLGAGGGIAAAALAAGLAALVPLDTSTGETQTWLSIMLRAAIFAVITGASIGVLSARHRIDGETEYHDMRRMLAGFDRQPTGLAVTAGDVSRVLHEGSYSTVYQPIYSLHSGDLIAVEALARFDSAPDHSPDAWFAAAYAHGQGPDLEIAAVASALEHAASLPRHVRLSINVGPDALTDPRLALLLADAREYHRVMVEITEHTAIENYQQVQEALSRLRALGVTVAVDDAGAGFSSLRHVLQLHPDVIKIDRLLAAEITASPTRQALGKTLVDFGHQAGAEVVIEGIECESDLVAWRTLGAEAVQGYLTGRPGALPVPSRSAIVIKTLNADERREFEADRRGTPMPPVDGDERDLSARAAEAKR